MMGRKAKRNDHDHSRQLLLFSSDGSIPAHVTNLSPEKRLEADRIRNSISAAFTEPLQRFQENPRAGMYGIHFGTGSGKTYQVSRLAKLVDSERMLLIYTTSNKLLVEQARSQFENALRGTETPVYVHLGIDDHWSSEIINKDALPFIEEIRSLRRVDTVSWERIVAIYAKNSTRSARAQLPMFDDFLDAAHGAAVRLQKMTGVYEQFGVLDTETEEPLRKARRALAATLTKLCILVTRVDVGSGFSFTRMRAPIAARLCRRIFPLDYALYDRPGPIIMSHAKFNTGPAMATHSGFKEKRSAKKNAAADRELPTPGSHVMWTHYVNEKFGKGTITIIDEEEDGYVRMFDSLNAKIDSPQTWFPTITSLSIYFHWGMFSSRQSPDLTGWRNLLFDRLEFMVGGAEEIAATIDMQRRNLASIEDCKEVVWKFLGLEQGIMCPAADEIYALLDKSWRPLKSADGASQQTAANFGLEYYENCWKSILLFQQFIEHHKLFEDEPNILNRWNRFFDIVSGKHRLVITKSTLAEISGHLQYLFFDNNLRLVDQEMLGHTFVRIVPDNGDLELVYRPEGAQDDLFGLAVLLRLLLWTALVISGTSLKIPPPGQRVDPQDVEYVKQINDLKRIFTNKAFGLRLLEASVDLLESSPDLLINDDLVFEQAKGFFTITVDEQSIRGQEYLSAYFSVNALLRSPESVLLSGLFGSGGAENPCHLNLVYPMSATSDSGGVWEFNRPYIDDQVALAGGVRLGFTAEHEAITEQLRNLSPRTVEVGFFEDGRCRTLMGVCPANQRLLAAVLPEPTHSALYVQNRHKRNELGSFYDTAAHLVELSGPKAGMFFCQTATFIVDALEAGIAIGMKGVRRADPQLRQIYELDPVAIGMRTDDPRPLVVIVYEAQFFRKLHYGSTSYPPHYTLNLDGEMVPAEQEFQDALDDKEPDEEELDRLQTALAPYSHLEKNKLLFVSRYMSADRGLSIHCYENGEKRDYDFITLANHRYYDSFVRRKDGKIATMEQFMAACKQLRSDGSFNQVTMNEVARILCERPLDLLYQAMILERFTSVIQTIGRVDRGRVLPHTQTLYVTADYVPDIIEGNDLAGGFERRSAKLPHTLILAARDYVSKRSPVIPDFDSYAAAEVARAMAFLATVDSFRRDMFSSDPTVRGPACQTWATMRSILAMTDPKAYVQRLHETIWPYGEANRDDFISYLYMDGEAFGGDPRFFRITDTDQTYGGETIRIIGDYTSSPKGKLYRPADTLLRNSLLESGSSSDYRRMCIKLGLRADAIFTNFKPRPHFLQNFIKGFIGEILTAEAISMLGVKILPEAWAMKLGIFERFDHYCRLRSGRLVAIDSKHWTPGSDQKLSSELRDRAPAKARAVQEILGERVLFLYINTFGGTNAPPVRSSTFDIEFISLFKDRHDAGNFTHRFKEIFDA
ncbi:hypothetical protein [Massilia aquatica]|uniref:Helicase/UvrB N-terminal domain-containing protein n=1 Tax=Massilia aquatica TaxID=2609000 RepID=A0ABX0MKN4_9BURK|nr:hypothetical protein [Massilia aquatica]NHZ44955.1 hypothetical protein [Massilia aquatica]